MQKLHMDLRFKDPCNALNNALEDKIRMSSFKLRRKLGLVILAMTIKSLKTVCPSRWFSSWSSRGYFGQLAHHCVFLEKWPSQGDEVWEAQESYFIAWSCAQLARKMRFLKTNSCAVLSIMKELEAENTLVHQVYPVLGVRLHALISQWCDATEVFASDVTSLLGLLDENDRSTTFTDTMLLSPKSGDRHPRGTCAINSSTPTNRFGTVFKFWIQMRRTSYPAHSKPSAYFSISASWNWRHEPAPEWFCELSVLRNM